MKRSDFYKIAKGKENKEKMISLSNKIKFRDENIRNKIKEEAQLLKNSGEKEKDIYIKLADEFNCAPITIKKIYKGYSWKNNNSIIEKYKELLNYKEDIIFYKEQAGFKWPDIARAIKAKYNLKYCVKTLAFYFSNIYYGNSFENIYK